MSSDIWNPWHGCRKYSEGCENCYMFYLDRQRDQDGGQIYKVKTNFNLPLKRDRQGNFKIKSGKGLRVCMTSDFFWKRRTPVLLGIPARHKGVMAAPLIGRVDLERYLATGQLETVFADGENYDGRRPLHEEWVKLLYEQCKRHDVPFSFFGTGNVFIKDGKEYHICKAYQHVQALRSGLQYPGVVQEYPIQKRCAVCKKRNSCNGCRWCGKCAAFDRGH